MPDVSGHNPWRSPDVRYAYTPCGVVRPCAEGFKVGPLFASNPQQAQAVLLSLLSQLPLGSQVQADVPAQHGAAIE